jgi:hypothetical protein
MRTDKAEMEKLLDMGANKKEKIKSSGSSGDSRSSLSAGY